VARASSPGKTRPRWPRDCDHFSPLFYHFPGAITKVAFLQPIPAKEIQKIKEQNARLRKSSAEGGFNNFDF
jgi:hypothetical protein